MELKQKKAFYRQIAIYTVAIYLVFTFVPLAIYKATASNNSADKPVTEQNVEAPQATKAPTPESKENETEANKEEPVVGFLEGRQIFTANSNVTSTKSESEDVFRIKDIATDEVITVTAREFLPAATVCEMSVLSPDEALKAQAVAAYTYYSVQRTANKDKEYDFTCNSDKWLIYVNAEKMQTRWGEDYDNYWNRIKTITDSVYGEMVVQNGEPILSTYFAVSNGSTEASANVWGGERTYLTSVASPGDTLSDSYLSKLSLTPEQVKEKLSQAFTDVNFDFNVSNESWFSNQNLSNAGYTKTIQVCGVEVEGTKLRTALSLSSTSFDVNFEDGHYVFTVRGRGHGVGMSQIGAMYMAQQGSNYQQILSHYYPETTVANSIG